MGPAVRWVVVVLAGAVFLTLPAALVGGVVAVLAGGGVLSLGSLVGLVLVLAVATRQRHPGGSAAASSWPAARTPHRGGLVMGAAAERLGLILLTAVAIAWPWRRWRGEGGSPATRSSSRWPWCLRRPGHRHLLSLFVTSPST